MRRLLVLLRRDRLTCGQERGQAMVLFAAGLAGFLGLVGMALDVGNVLHTRTDLQKAADAAALAGVQELASLSPSTSLAAAQANAYILKNLGGGIELGNAITDITFSQTVRPDDTITVEVDRPVGYTFLKAVGLSGTTVSATAKARIRVVTGYRFDEMDIFPYTVWGGDRSAGHTNACAYNICEGSTQVYRSNQWDSDNFVTGPGWGVNGNNFKGYFHAGTGLVQLDPNTWQTFSKGGNAMGQQPLAALDAHVASGVPIIVPVVAAAKCSGGCGNIDFKIVAWVALKLNPRGNASQPWTGTVVGNFLVPGGDTSGASVPPSNFPAQYTASLLQ